jgi:DNA polymerase-3 subunit gamma/tau
VVPEVATSAPRPAAAAKPERELVAPGSVTFQQVKDSWPEILEAVQEAKRSAWAIVYTSQPRALADDVLTVSFVSQNDVDAFKQGGPSGVSEVLRTAIIQVLGLRVKFIARVEGPAAAPVAEGAPVEPVEPIRDEPEPPERVELVETSPTKPTETSPTKPTETSPTKLKDRAQEVSTSSTRVVDAQGWAVAEIPQDDAPTAKAPRARSVPKVEAAASTAPARYGESVVRELLGANFIEEQAIAPKVVPRPAEGD